MMPLNRINSNRMLNYTIIHNDHWNPSKLHDPLSEILEEPIPLPDNMEFHPAQILVVDMDCTRQQRKYQKG